MRICIFGAGAVGGNFAVRLARVGNDVSIVARGEHLNAIRRDGLMLLAGEESIKAEVRTAAAAAELGEQDVVLITLKATSLRGLPAMIAPLLGCTTPVVFAQNGIPWWYAQGLKAAAPTPDLAWMDPGGEMAALGDRVIGGVIYSANEVVAPGVVRNKSPGSNRLVIGEPDDGDSERICVLRAALRAAGLTSPDTRAIRHAVWSKLVLNMSSSVLGAVTGVPAAELRRDTAFETLYRRLHAEAGAVAKAHCPDLDIPEPLQGGIGHKPSMLQDYERRRPMEIDALVAAPLDFARTAGVATPTLDLLAALVAEKARRAGLYAPARQLPL
jgi:2-dehydropantoate 2-reductase